MEAPSVCSRIKESISKVSRVPISEIADDVSFRDLELDSLSLIEVLIEIEREFDLSIPEDVKLAELGSLPAVACLVEKHLCLKVA